MKIAVYAGTFDPITDGHLDVASRASRLFDKVIFAVAVDNYKDTLFSIEERCSLARQAVADYPNIVVEPFEGLLVEYCKRVGATSIIRGLRAVSDFDKELQMALMNRSMNPEVDTVFLMSDARYLYISSSLIKNAALFGGDVEKMVPPCVFQALKEKIPALREAER